MVTSKCSSGLAASPRRLRQYKLSLNAQRTVQCVTLRSARRVLTIMNLRVLRGLR